jgi:diguanylate cyclase (GGDEF)-like protein
MPLQRDRHAAEDFPSMTSQQALLDQQLEEAWRVARTRFHAPALLVVSCEDGCQVRRQVLTLAAAAGPGVDGHLLAVPARQQLQPLEPLLSWWGRQGNAADRLRAVAGSFSYAPMRAMLSDAAAGAPLARDEMPLPDEVHFERASLHVGLARALAQSSPAPQIVLIGDLENAGPSVLAVLRQLADTPCAAPLLLVLQVAMQRCLTELHFEAEWEEFIEWVGEHDAMVSMAGTGTPAAPASWCAPDIAVGRLRVASMLMAFDEIASTGRELIDEAAQAWPATIRQDLQLLHADALLHLGETDDALAALEAVGTDLEPGDDVIRQGHGQRLLAYAFQQRQDFDLAQAAATKAIALAERTPSLLDRARALFALYYIYDRSTITIPLAEFRRLLMLLERCRLDNLLLYCLRNYYLYLRFSDEVSTREVLAFSRRAIRLARASGHTPALAATFHSRGILHSYRHEYAAMFRSFSISERLRIELGEPLDLVRIRNGIGYFHTLLEQHERAFEYYVRAFSGIRRQRDYSEILVSLFNIAWLYLVTRHYRSAIELADKVLAICRARRLTHFPFRNLFDVHTLKGFCHVSLGEQALAQQCLDRMLQLPFQPSPSGEFLRMLLRGKLAMAQGDLEQARAQLESAPAWLAGETGVDSRMRPSAYLELAELSRKRGDIAGAIGHLNHASTLCRASSMPLSLAHVDEAIARLRAEPQASIEAPPETLPLADLALDDLVAMAQQQTRLDDARKRLREVNLLSGLQRMTNQPHDLQGLAKAALRLVAGNLSAHTAALFQCTSEGWQVLSAFGDEDQAAALAQHLSRLPAGAGVFVENRIHREGEIGTRASYRSIVCLPLPEEGRVNAALVLTTEDSSRYFDSHDRAVLGLIAAQLASQFAQLGHRDRLTRMSTTDALTGLANRQALQARLHDDMLASAAAGERVALAYIDLDNFKHVNDNFGHAAGDAVLRAFSDLLRGCLRDGDIAARWGGDEFVIFFPGTSSANACRVADRILAALEASGRFGPLLATTAGAPPAWPTDRQLGCSIGIADAARGPHGALDDKQLLERADAALYQAKAAGKNRISQWTDDAQDAFRQISPTGPGTPILR